VNERAQELRLVEALLFAASEPLGEETMSRYLDPPADVSGLLRELAEEYAGRGVNLVRLAGGWVLRTAPDGSRLGSAQGQTVRSRPASPLGDDPRISHAFWLGQPQRITRS